MDQRNGAFATGRWDDKRAVSRLTSGACINAGGIPAMVTGFESVFGVSLLAEVELDGLLAFPASDYLSCLV